MEAKLNIAEILKDKPKGTKLYADAFGELKLVKVDKVDTIYTRTKEGMFYSFYNNGKYDKNGEPILVPSKEIRDWSKFAWKKGDVLVSEGMGGLYVIFEGFDNDTYTTFKGKHYLCNYNDNEDYHKELILRTIEFKKDNVNDAKSYINTIEERFDGKLNLETLEIEKQPEFKDGDIVAVDLDRKNIRIFKEKKNENNICWGKYYIGFSFNNEGKPIQIFEDYRADCESDRLATDTEKQQLFEALAKEGKTWDAEKKQIVDLKPKWITLKPFDKVLVRDGKDEIWEPAFFFRNRPELNVYKYQTVGGKLRVYCIPFNERTAKLIGTSDDWKG